MKGMVTFAKTALCAILALCASHKGVIEAAPTPADLAKEA